MPSFPHEYEVTLEGAVGGAWSDAPPRRPILGGAPPEFGGRAGWWSPEHLLLSSLGLCFLETYRALARAARIEFTDYSSRVRGTLDKTPEGLRFVSFHLDVQLAVSGADGPRAEALLERAKKQCIVSNSLKVPIEVRGAVAAAA